MDRPHNDARVSWIRVSSINLPLAKSVSDAKVFAGLQRPLTHVAVLSVEIKTASGNEGFGYSYALRTGGSAQYAHAKEIAPLLLGEDANDIGRLWDKLLWASASIGRQGLSVQAIAAFDIALWDMKAKRADLSLANLLGSRRRSLRCYNSSGGYLHTSIEELLENMARAKAGGFGGLKMKIGHSDPAIDLKRIAAARELLGDDFPLMVDVNQQWDRSTAKRIGHVLDQFNLVFLEEPLASNDAEGHADLAARITTPIATGEMLSSVAEHFNLIRLGAVEYLQPDAPRVGGVTPFLKIMTLADQYNLGIAPHFVMEIHVQLMAAYSRDSWIEHFEWFEPLFNESLIIENGRIIVPDRPGLGLSLSENAASWITQQDEVFTPSPY